VSPPYRWVREWEVGRRSVGAGEDDFAVFAGDDEFVGRVELEVERLGGAAASGREDELVAAQVPDKVIGVRVLVHAAKRGAVGAQFEGERAEGPGRDDFSFDLSVPGADEALGVLPGACASGPKEHRPKEHRPKEHRPTDRGPERKVRPRPITGDDVPCHLFAPACAAARASER